MGKTAQGGPFAPVRGLQGTGDRARSISVALIEASGTPIRHQRACHRGNGTNALGTS